MAADSEQPSRKRRRVINSCSECFRRKQKCDHQRPCVNCTRRGVADKCVYDDGDDESFLHAVTATSSAASRPHAAHGTSSQQLQQPSPPSEGLRYYRREDDFIIATIANGAYRRLKADEKGPDAVELKYRDAISLLPSVSVLDGLLEIYFNECSWIFDIFERGPFERDYQTWRGYLPNAVPKLGEIRHDLKYFLPLLLACIGLAAQYLEGSPALLEQLHCEQPSDCDRLSQIYSDSAAIVLEALGEMNAGDLLIPIQARLLRTWWFKSVGKGTEAWHSLAQAIRHAQELRMHLRTTIEPLPQENLSDTLTRVWAEEQRRRLWIGLVFWDAQVSMVLNRPRLIHLIDCDLEPPIDCPFPRDPSQTLIINNRAVGLDKEPPTSVSLVFIHYKIGLLVHELRDLESALRRKPPKAAKDLDPTALHTAMTDLLHDLPPILKLGPGADTTWDTHLWYLEPQRYILLSTAHTFLMNLHKLFLPHRPASRRPVRTAALEVLATAAWLFAHTRPHQLRFYGLVFPTVHASLLLFALVESYPDALAAAEHPVADALDAGIARLQAVEHCNTTARAGLQLLLPWRERCRAFFARAAHTPDSAAASGLTAANARAHAGPPTPLLEVEGEFDVDYWIAMMGSVVDVSTLFADAGPGEPGAGFHGVGA